MFHLGFIRGLLVVTAVGVFAAAVPARGEETFAVTKGIPYAQRGETSLLADVYVPKGEGPFPGVLVVHGGAWMAGNKSRMANTAKLLAEHGYTAVSINYRLAPQHVWPAQIEDCKTAVRWMRQNAAQYKIDPTRMAGYGYSAGGQLVALLGTTDATCGLEGLETVKTDPNEKPAGVQPNDVTAACDTRLQCIVAGGAPCDFRLLPPRSPRLSYWLGGTRLDKPLLYEQASPANFISRDDPPMFFYHGAVDAVVPLDSPQNMAKQMTAAGCQATVYVVPDAGHVAAFLDMTAASEAVKFLDAQLKPPAAKPQAQ